MAWSDGWDEVTQVRDIPSTTPRTKSSTLSLPHDPTKRPGYVAPSPHRVRMWSKASRTCDCTDGCINCQLKLYLRNI